MNAWQCDDSRPVPGLFASQVEIPHPAPGELLIRVHAAGVTPTELIWYPTTHTKSGENRQHAIPGHEFSGVVAAVGADVDAEIGQEVFGMNDWFSDGATAEFCCALQSAVSPKPVRLTHAEAATVPIGALTAWQGLFDRANLQAGDHVLIHGGSGAVGVFAIQLAHIRGAKITTTASARDQELLLQLGATRVIDYHTEKFEEFVNDVDVVFDAVGGATLQRSWNLLKPTGRLVTVAASGETAVDDRTQKAFFIVEPHQSQLCEIAGLLDSGQLQPVVDVEVTWDEAAKVYSQQALPKLRRGCGKAVVMVTPGEY